ncbi:MAG: hypothetical protein C3F06_11025 [Candidatus Methanoperedenaceae archaeon]|nr:MAG: hypothetical protein C3F06_11025 [Candidatus Methanoperedenaceae archaeon]
MCAFGEKLEAEGYKKMANMSEDALFKALLKNKPPQQPPKPMVAQSIPRKEIPRPAAAPPVERYQVEEPRIEPKIAPVVQPVNLEPVVDSINRLNSSINMIQGIMKNIITPILILILVVSIGILIQSK